MSIGTEIAKLRAEAGWSQARLSRETGMSSSYLYYVENDEVLPSADKLGQIVRALGGDPERIVRIRDELALSRLDLDAPTVLRLKEEFGDLSDEEREAAAAAIRDLRAGRPWRRVEQDRRGAPR
jgi:transcriptional regulator with XRE-family HTH domain